MLTNAVSHMRFEVLTGESKMILGEIVGFWCRLPEFFCLLGYYTAITSMCNNPEGRRIQMVLVFLGYDIMLTGKRFLTFNRSLPL
jgi:hypothetical protein